MMKVLSLPYAFVMMNWAAVVSLFWLVRHGKHPGKDVWTRRHHSHAGRSRREHRDMQLQG